MSKELEAFDVIKFNPDNVDGLQYIEAFKVVESALQRLEAIDNAKPSDAIKCLESMSNEKALFRSILSRSTVYMGGEQIDDFSDKSTIGNKFKGAIPIIEQALIKAQEQEKENAEYKQLEEELGCLLKVIRQLFKQDFIYFKYPANVQVMKVKVIKRLSYGSNPDWYFTCIYDNLDFIYISLKDYKKTWWLKEDKSE